MKIIQLIQKKQMRGAEVFASQLSSHLMELGHEVLIIALLDGKDQLPFKGEIICLNADFKKKLFDIPTWKKLADIIKIFKPDIIQANAGDTLKYAVFSKLLFRWKQPLIFRNASMASRYTKTFFSKIFMRFLYSKANHIASVSSITKKDLVDCFAISKKKITTIPVGIEIKPLNKIAVFNNSKINLIHVGGFSFEKNHEGLLSIFKMLLLKNNQLKLWMLGEGPLRNKIQKMVIELQLENHVEFLGFVNNPMDYIHSGDVLLLPSIIEGLPGVILESFYCETPVVAYNVGGISELITNHKTGMLIEAGNESQFAEAIIEFLSVEAHAKNDMVKLAYEKVMADYTNKKIALNFLSMYLSFIQNKSEIINLKANEN
jgi:glycosyltransferase involved in cell wall biosynthesis